MKQTFILALSFFVFFLTACTEDDFSGEVPEDEMMEEVAEDSNEETEEETTEEGDTGDEDGEDEDAMNEDPETVAPTLFITGAFNRDTEQWDFDAELLLEGAGSAPISDATVTIAGASLAYDNLLEVYEASLEFDEAAALAVVVSHESFEDQEYSLNISRFGEEDGMMGEETEDGLGVVTSWPEIATAEGYRMFRRLSSENTQTTGTYLPGNFIEGTTFTTTYDEIYNSNVGGNVQFNSFLLFVAPIDRVNELEGFSNESFIEIVGRPTQNGVGGSRS